MAQKIRGIYLNPNAAKIDAAFSPEIKAKLAGQGVRPEVVTDLKSCNFDLSQVECIFSTWGMPKLTEEDFARLPSLKVVFYAAGTVKPFADPLVAHNVKIVNAVKANAVPVAEYAASQILLANKGFFRNYVGMRQNDLNAFVGYGNYHANVSLLGFGNVARGVFRFLKQTDLIVNVYDPYLSEEEAAKLGVNKVDLDTAFKIGNVVSCHLPNIPETERIVTKAHFLSMPKDAVFINTGRGASICEDALIEVLQERSDFFALLDVTCPEPAATDSPLRKLPNVILTSHIAGSLSGEIFRMGEFVARDFENYLAGKPMQNEIDPAMLSRMA